jgi:hypothetical protein
MAKMLQKPYVGGDWLIREDEYEYTRSTYVVDNSAGAADMVLAGGYPFKSGVPALAADVNAALPTPPAAPTINGALLEPVTIPKGEKKAVAVLERGFNVVNQGSINNPMLPTSDYAGTAFTAWTTLGGWYNYMHWLVRSEPATQTEGVKGDGPAY